MRIYVYGKEHDTGDQFEDYLDPAKTAVISIDLHRGHLDESPDCPCPALFALAASMLLISPPCSSSALRRLGKVAARLSWLPSPA